MYSFSSMQIELREQLNIVDYQGAEVGHLNVSQIFLQPIPK